MPEAISGIRPCKHFDARSAVVSILKWDVNQIARMHRGPEFIQNPVDANIGRYTGIDAWAAKPLFEHGATVAESRVASGDNEQFWTGCGSRIGQFVLKKDCDLVGDQRARQDEPE